MTQPILEVKNLTKTFAGRGKNDLVAVDHVSFQLGAGETLGIVGESGSGKSTLVKAILRLLDVDFEEIFLNGQEITHLKGRKLREAYRQFQMVFQSPVSSFDPRRTLGDGIGESLRNSGKSKEETKRQVGELLTRCGLPAEYAKRYPHQVSGGQCQRAAIARALAISPKLLICDEATSALDVTVQQQIIELLGQLREGKGIAYLFICHNLALVQQFCHRVLVMKDGRIVEEGIPDEVIFHPKHRYTKELVEAIL